MEGISYNGPESHWLSLYSNMSGHSDFMCIGSDIFQISRTLCFSRNSLLSGALINTRRSLEGAEKYALRDFLREEAAAINRTESVDLRHWSNYHDNRGTLPHYQ
jgi:hypothetical protein